MEIAAREGARIVWLPTVDAENEAREHAARPAGSKLPLWATLQEELRQRGVPIAPVPVVDASGAVVAPLRQVLRVVAAHDLVLATGHVSRDEIFAVVEAALEEGVRRVVVTHPDYPSQHLSPADQVGLAARGAYMERCLAPVYSGKVAWDDLFAAIRAVGVTRSLLSTDLGQLANPPVEDGLALFADRLLEAGFTEEEVRIMAVTNTIALAQEGTPP